jgi:hypothetical protein
MILMRKRLEQLADSGDALLADHAQWALNQFAPQSELAKRKAFSPGGTP